MTTKRLFLLATRAFKGFGDDNCSQLSAALAYRVIFAIVPLTMFVASVFGLLAGTDEVQERISDELVESLDVQAANVTVELTDDGRDRIQSIYGNQAVAEVEQELAALSSTQEEDLAEAIEAGEMVGVGGYSLTSEDVDVMADNLVAETIRGAISASGPVSVITFIVLAYSATAMFGAIRRSLNFIWDVPVRRAFVRGKVVDLMLLLSSIGLLLVFLLSIALTATLRALGEERGGWDGALFSNGISFLLPWFVTFLFCLLAYRYGPRVQNRVGDVWLGAALAATGLEILKFGYGIYVANFSSFDAFYGALAGVLLFLLLVYFAGYVFFFGAEVAAEYPGVRRGDYDEAASDEPSRPLREVVVDFAKSFLINRPPDAS